VTEGSRLDHRLEGRDEASVYRRVEVITGRRQRRQWTAEEKARIVAESAAPGANISAVARRFGVHRGLLTVWRREAGLVSAEQEGVDRIGFMRVEVDSDGAAPETPCRPAGDAALGRIELDLRHGQVVFTGGVDPALAAAVIGAVRRRG